MRIGRESVTSLLLNSSLETSYEQLQFVNVQVLIELHATNLLYLLDDSLKRVDIGFIYWLHAEYNVTVHLYEAAIRVIYEMRIAGFSYHTLSYFVVETKVKNGVHHTGHRSTGTRTYGYKERVLRIAELAVHQILGVLYGCEYIVAEHFYNFLLTYFVILVANVGRDGETGRYRYADMVHLGEVCTFATKFGTHRRIALCLAVTKKVNSFLLFHC